MVPPLGQIGSRQDNMVRKKIFFPIYWQRQTLGGLTLKTES